MNFVENFNGLFDQSFFVFLDSKLFGQAVPRTAHGVFTALCLYAPKVGHRFSHAIGRSPLLMRVPCFDVHFAASTGSGKSTRTRHLKLAIFSCNLRGGRIGIDWPPLFLRCGVLCLAKKTLLISAACRLSTFLSRRGTKFARPGGDPRAHESNPSRSLSLSHTLTRVLLSARFLFSTKIATITRAL